MSLFRIQSLVKQIMLVAAIVILVVMVTLAFITLVAFSWAASNHQFENSEEASHVIFDADECIGHPTDPNLQRENNTENASLVPPSREH